MAVRATDRAPTFALATVAILGLGVGTSTAMFAISQRALADGLPVAAQDRLVVMHPLDRGGANIDAPYPYLREIARDTAMSAAPDFFDVLGVRAVLDRTFVAAEDGRTGAQPVILLSYAARHGSIPWRRCGRSNVA